MAVLVYLLCFVTSAASATLLSTMYAAHRTHLLRCSSLCLCGLAANNALLLIDLVVAPPPALILTRAAVAAAAMLTLVIGLIWDLF
jgi:Family of unknown function (DUF5985)